MGGNITDPNLYFSKKQLDGKKANVLSCFKYFIKKNNCQATNIMMGMLSKALTSVSGNEPSVSMSAGANEVLPVTILNKSSL